MPAIITDQFRILNAETFTKSVTGIGTTSNFYYTFLAHPNPTNVSIVDYGDANWTSIPPDPKDSFQQEDRYADSMLFLKKIGINDFARIVSRVNWASGITYDMYKNNYDITNDAPQTSAKTLYESRFYIVNSEFKVYICINNGSSPDFVDGRPSQFEPTFVDTAPQVAGDGSDGYLWKYLYTITPADIVKFTTEKYMPVPANWGDVNTAAVKDAAVRGHVETVVIKNRGTGYTSGTTTDIDILGDGSGGKVSITVTDQEVSSIEVTDGGKDYTKGLINFTGAGGSGAEFEVIIPPKGGHGADIYRELGTYRVMIYSKYDTAADFAAQNNFSRIGIVRNPNEFGSSTSILNKNTATSLGALKLTGAGNTSDTIYKLNAEIRQSVGTAGSFAVGYVASWDRDTGVLRYYQPVGFTTLTGNNFKNVDFESNGNVINTSPSTDVEGSPLQPDTNFNGSSVTLSNKVVDLGQTFAGGKANPEVEKFSGDIIYIDNRAPVGRSESQKEEVKIVVEF
tara:strand:- start:5869 stop:7398 length:1530 start_codon:yes stop_codon:yes gene_type:complete